MARIAGVDLPNEKRIEIALTYIFGIGRPTAEKILQMTGVNPDTRVKSLTEEETGRLRQVIESQLKVEGARRSEVAMNIKRLMDIGAYRGLRHRKNLPVRGQRTRTNARTRKGPKKTAGAIKRIAAAPKRPAPKPAG
ncbi:MAG TPA: 30S ribosomal protein S13 [Candidatus Eisenbacteria bacterium]|nr:30S ribosomal protein S13 [Candidatus Eisenbacteria bacterium]